MSLTDFVTSQNINLKRQEGNKIKIKSSQQTSAYKIKIKVIKSK